MELQRNDCPALSEMRPYVKAKRVAAAGMHHYDAPHSGGADQHSGRLARAVRRLGH